MDSRSPRRVTSVVSEIPGEMQQVRSRSMEHKASDIFLPVLESPGQSPLSLHLPDGGLLTPWEVARAQAKMVIFQISKVLPVPCSLCLETHKTFYKSSYFSLSLLTLPFYKLLTFYCHFPSFPFYFYKNAQWLKPVLYKTQFSYNQYPCLPLYTSAKTIQAHLRDIVRLVWVLRWSEF